MISDYYEDEELISQLRMFFDDDEQEQIDFKASLNLLTDFDEEKWELKIKDRVFLIDKELCEVEEVEQ